MAGFCALAFALGIGAGRERGVNVRARLLRGIWSIRVQLFALIFVLRIDRGWRCDTRFRSGLGVCDCGLGVGLGLGRSVCARVLRGLQGIRTCECDTKTFGIELAHIWSDGVSDVRGAACV